MQSLEVMFVPTADARALIDSGTAPLRNASIALTADGQSALLMLPNNGDLVNYKRDGQRVSGKVSNRLFIYDEKNVSGEPMDVAVQVMIFVDESDSNPS